MSFHGSFEYFSVYEWLHANGIDSSISGNQVRIVCPLCSPSKDKDLSIHNESGLWHCWKCGLGGLFPRLSEHLRISDDTLTLRDVVDDDRHILLPLADDYKRIVDENAQQLLRGGAKEKAVREWFLQKKGLTTDTLIQFNIGWSGRSITIPVYSVDNELLTIRYRQDPTSNTAIKGSKFWSFTGQGTHLFNSRVLTEESEEVYLANEGEFKAMMLSQLGYSALSHTGGAGGFQKEWVELFESYDIKTVYIIGDNDQAGKDGARKTASAITNYSSKKIEARIVEFNSVTFPNPKGDINDFFTRENISLDKSKKEFNALLGKSKIYSEEKEDSPAMAIYEQMKEAGFKSFRVEYRPSNIFVISPHDPICAYDLNGQGFNDLLLNFYFEKFQDALTDAQIEKIKSLFRAQATSEYIKKDNKAERIYTRYYKEGAGSTTVVFFDMGNSKNAVRIDKDGYSVETGAPARFVKSPLDMPQVMPKQDANPFDLKKILDYTNLATESDRILYLCHLVCGLIPNIRHNALVMSGNAGTGKSTHMSISRIMTDPSTNGDVVPVDGGFYAPGTDDGKISTKQLQQQAQWGYCLYMDNLIGLDNGASAYLCTLVTGGISVERTLYTNNEPYPMIAYPLIALNGINLVAKQPDLLSRSLVLETGSKEFQVNDVEFWADFNKNRAEMLGGLYATVSRAIALYDQTPQEGILRLGEAGHFMLCAGLALGYTKEEFVAAINMNNHRRYQGAIESSAVSESLLYFLKDKLSLFMYNLAQTKEHPQALADHDFRLLDYEKFDNGKNRYRFTINQTELYKKLRDISTNDIGNGDIFPKSADSMMKRVYELASFLEKEYGFQIQRSKRYDKSLRGSGRVVVIYIDEADAQQYSD